MEQVTSSYKAWFLFWAILVFDLVFKASSNVEGDALNALKSSLSDPNNVLQSWDATLVNPCTWFHVTCNGDNSVTRVELYSNNITGKIPEELGNLTNLVSLDLYLNNLSGNIPTTLGNLQKLRFLRLNNNTLTGHIPVLLTNVSSLQVLDLSNNNLEGNVPVNGSFSLFTPISYQNNPRLIQPKNTPAPLSPPSPSSSGSSNTGAIAGGVAAGAALLFAAPAIALAYWRKRKPADHFFDVPGLLKDKKLETLVDAELKGDYADEEVEQLIQVALLCTQGSPMERPKMSEVVRMLEGDGLAEKWEQWQKEETYRQDFNNNHMHHPNANWIVVDSTSNIQPDELSGPR
ncbi:hypothetical protein TSUD_389630 [Trifolium subterraneum]|uniref:Leucine-rich repeat-containing N-terminal plant-type domain-containing protein n=1 Tax=Trifolium subterraneum TaxID=3900 RepID=A0A2Z6NDG1_TRISU|nr:hypothetical protein TSUD_389630 [Trifolium subterraneum]